MVGAVHRRKFVGADAVYVSRNVGQQKVGALDDEEQITNQRIDTYLDTSVSRPAGSTPNSAANVTK